MRKPKPKTRPKTRPKTIPRPRASPSPNVPIKSVRFMTLSPNSTLRPFKPSPNTYENIERDAAAGHPLSRDLLAIEDASEMAKTYMFDTKNIFEKILGSVSQTPIHCNTFSNRSKLRCLQRPPSNEIMHIAYHIGNNVGGHYSSAVKVGPDVVFFDSMCQSEYGPKFKKYIETRYGPNVKVTEAYNRTKYQPSGGFPPNKEDLKKFLGAVKLNVSETDLNKIHKISQYDLLSQHHFCYIESLVYLFHRILRTSMGPIDPEQRLRFIKSVMWCLIVKYVRPNENTAMYKYFKHNFRFYVKLNNVVYNNRGFYMPTNKEFTYSIKKIRFMPVSQAKNASIEAIIQWSLEA